MIKFVVAALWISLATTGALLFSFKTATKPEPVMTEEEANAFKGIDYVKTGVISVPVFSKGKVYGYFLARLVFTAEGKRLAELKLPPDAILTDQIYSYLYANAHIDFTKRDSLDVDAFRRDIRLAVNERLGEEFIKEILIEQVDFLPKDQVGKGAAQPAAAPAKPQAAGTGH